MQNFQTGNFKQKNKPFKGKRKDKNKFKGMSLNSASGAKLRKRIAKKERKTNGLDIETHRKSAKKQSKRALRRQHNKVRREVNSKQEIQIKKKIISQSQVLEPNIKESLIKNIKSLKNTKIIAVFDCNGCGLSEIMMQIQNTFKGQNSADRLNLQGNMSPNGVSSNFQYLYISGDNSGYNQLSKQNFLFISCERELFSLLDLFKVADIIMPVATAKKIDYSILNTNPKDALNVIDETGLDTIVWLRSQGLLPAQPVILHINEVPKNKAKNVRFYLDRLFKEEFDTKNSAQFLEKPNDLMLMMLKLWNVKSVPITWREPRGYLLVEKVSIDGNQVFLQGESRGAGFSVNELVHITGIGDFLPASLAFEAGKGHSHVQGTYLCVNPDPMEIFADEANQNVQEADANKMDQNGLGMEIEKGETNLQDELDILNQQISNMKMAGFEFEEEPYIIPQERIEEGGDFDISFDEGEDVVDDKKRAKLDHFKLESRDQEEKEFEDEVEFQPNEILRKRLKNYNFLTSFKNNIWDRLDSIPDYHRKLFHFDKFDKIRKIVKQKHRRDITVVQGCKIGICFNSPELVQALVSHSMEKPLILSSLFKHERKMTLNHNLVQLHKTFDKKVISKENFLVQNGFRRFAANLTFSSIVRGGSNHKLLRSVSQNNAWFLASYYAPLYFSPNLSLIFDPNSQEPMTRQKILTLDIRLLKASDFKISMIGRTLKSNPFLVILKRIILTGYPIKIKKKRAIVKYMFFNPPDSDFFKKNELYTKLGLRGNILSSVGTHGSMKCLFNGKLKQCDTVCMNLYKRVFPKFLF